MIGVIGADSGGQVYTGNDYTALDLHPSNGTAVENSATGVSAHNYPHG